MTAPHLLVYFPLPSTVDHVVRPIGTAMLDLLNGGVVRFLLVDEVGVPSRIIWIVNHFAPAYRLS